ncbi:MAG: PEP-CTERM sorting domain-containing protein [Candidatus Omnitrophica bacterium]|nr:PEP-CTERM sorting domain-containing protein [Candidatus Omnitrophota bacterium]
MKKLVLIVACMLASAAAYAQGTVNFSNYAPASGVNAPIYYIDGVTKLAGTAYMAQLYAGIDAGSLAAVGDPLAFRTGAGAGFLVASSAPYTIPGIGGGATATLQVRAWEVATGATWDAAQVRGQSDTFQLALGNAGQPPTPPADLVGLKSFNLAAIPEPSTIALGILGAGLLLIRRRK